MTKGFHVLSSSNGKEALSSYNSYNGKIDLLISDISMPEMSGVDLVNQLRKDHPNIKVLFTSGYAGNKFKSSNIIDNSLTFLLKNRFLYILLLIK